MGIFFTETILNMSLTASVIILCVMAARLLLKKAPKIYSYALWGVVLFRLLCPVSFTAPVSVLEATKPQVTEVGNVSVVTYRYVQSTAEEAGLAEPHIRTEPVSVQELQQLDPRETILDIASHIWLAGMAAMTIYSAGIYFRLHRQLREAILWKKGIYLCDFIDSPFVLGLFHPRIYLPSDTPMKERRYIIAHERHHIRRWDHIVKWLAYIALCIHWFNSLVWIAFILAGKDMEMSCDEAVIKKLGEHIRADYSASLLRLATGRRMITGTPLAFGEGDTKGRVKNMASWHRPKLWVSTVCMMLCIAVLAACAVNPEVEKAEEQENTVSRLTLEVTIEQNTISYGELTLTIPANYAARLDEDGSVILSRDNLDVGGITHWPNPNPKMPHVTESDMPQWVADLGIPEAIQAVEERKQQEETGEIPEEPIAYMIEGGGDSVTAWFMNELHPEKLNKEHDLFVTECVVYDIWFDENVQTDAEAMEYLKTMRIAGEPTWMTEVEETIDTNNTEPEEIRRYLFGELYVSLPDDCTYMEEGNGTKLFRGETQIGGVTAYAIPQNASPDSTVWLRLLLEEGNDPNFGYMGGGSLYGDYEVNFFTDVPPGTEIETVDRIHTFFYSHNRPVVYDVWFDTLVTTNTYRNGILKTVTGIWEEPSLEPQETETTISPYNGVSFTDVYSGYDGTAEFVILTVPVDRDALEVENGLTLEELLNKAKEEFQTTRVNSFGFDPEKMGHEGRTTVEICIRDLRNGGDYLIAENTPVPTLELWGNRYYHFENGDTLGIEEESFKIMTLNALDGTVLTRLGKVQH